MLLERFGVNPPSLDSVLSFKIDGLQQMLPVQKVILQFINSHINRAATVSDTPTLSSQGQQWISMHSISAFLFGTTMPELLCWWTKINRL